MDDLKEKWDGKEVTTANIITISDWINNNAIIDELEQQDKAHKKNEEDDKRTNDIVINLLER